MDVEFNPDKARQNLTKHKVSFAHAEQALRDVDGLTMEDPDAEGEQRLATLVWTHWAGFCWWFTSSAMSGRV